MQTPEARVLIVDDEPLKVEALVAMVEGPGGEVAHVINDYGTAKRTFEAADFPHNVGGPNVVLIDATYVDLAHGHPPAHGVQGRELFLTGRRAGKFHDVRSRAPGIVAVSCSRDTNTAVARLTGGSVLAERPDLFRAAISNQASVPSFVPPGVMERSLEAEFFDQQPSGIYSLLHHAIGDMAVVRVVSLQITETVEEGADPHIRQYSADDLADLDDAAALRKAMTSTPYRVAFVRHTRPVHPPYSAVAAVQTDNHLLIIKHAQLARYQLASYGARENRDSVEASVGFDRIALGSIGAIPLEYWQDMGIDPDRLPGVQT